MRKLLYLLQLILLLPYFTSGQIDSTLLNAILANDISKVQIALDAGANLNATDKDGATALMWAIYKADVPIARLLVKNGAKTEICGLLAREKGGYYGNLTCIAADIGSIAHLKFLIEELKIPVDDRGYDPETDQKEGWAAAKWAAQVGQREAMDYLVSQGADELPLAPYYFHWGEYDKALRVYTQTLEKAEKEKGKESEDYAYALGSMFGFYLFTDMFDIALDYNKQELATWEKIRGKNSDKYAAALTNRALVFQKMGLYQKAIDVYQEAMPIYENSEGKGSAAYAIVLDNIGVQYKQIGAYEKAEEYLLQAENILKDKVGRVRPYYVRTLNNLGMMYLAKKDFAKSLDYFQKTLKIKEQYFKNQRTYVISLGNLGYLYSKMGELEKAENTLIETLDLTKKIYGENHSAYGSALFKLGRFYKGIDNNEQALAYFQQALDNTSKILGKQHPETAKMYNDIGKIYFDQMEYQNALAYFEESIKSAHIENLKENPNSEPFSKSLLIKLLNAKANALTKLYETTPNQIAYLEDACNIYQNAANLIEAVRQGYTRQEDKLGFLETASNIYQKGVLANQQLYEIKQNEAALHQIFNYLEKDQSLVLLESIKESDARHFAGIPPLALEQEQGLKRARTLVEEYLFKEKIKGSKADRKKITAYQQQLFNLQQSYDSIIHVMESQYANYYQLKYDTKVASVPDVQTYLSDNTALLEYMLGDNTLFVFAIDKAGVYYHQQAIDSTFFNKIEQIQSFLNTHLVYRTKKQQAEDKKNYIANAHALYQQLLHPILSKLSPVQELIIIPDGRLNYLPFEALLTQLPDEKYDTYDNLDYVLKDYLVRYEYSATLLLQGIKKQDSGKELFAGFAPIYEGNTLLASRSMDTTTYALAGIRENIAPLKYNQPEVSEISQALGGTPILGASATESAFKKQTSDYRILHLAMHGLVDDHNPDYSHLVFSEETDGQEDRYLYAYELYNMRLKADLAVLSACETGAGKLQKGEGVMSLSRAFKYAGVPNIIMSLWKADDISTKNLMTDFYKNLKKGESKSAALRAAKLQLIAQAKDNKEAAHPFFWSNFVLIGDAAPVNFNNQLWLWGLGGLALVVVGFTFWKRTNNKKI